jgi:AraC-like DNA-binding protein
MKTFDHALIQPSEMTNFFQFNEEVIISLPSIHNSFAMHRIEFFRKYHKLPIKPHRKPVFDFIFVTKGKSMRSRMMDNYDILPNQFFFLPAYQILTSEDMSLDIEGYYCHFDLELFQEIHLKADFVKDFSFLHYNGNPIVIIGKEKKQDIVNILNRLDIEYHNEGHQDMSLIYSYLYTLFLEIRKCASVDTRMHKDAASQITQKYKEALHQHIYRFQKVSDFAELLSISPNHLNRCVHATTGKSAQNFLIEMLILEAKVLLKQTTLNVSEIAMKIGNKEPSDFSRFFKSQTQMSPKEYRDS